MFLELGTLFAFPLYCFVSPIIKNLGNGTGRPFSVAPKLQNQELKANIRAIWNKKVNQWNILIFFQGSKGDDGFNGVPGSRVRKSYLV